MRRRSGRRPRCFSRSSRSIYDFFLSGFIFFFKGFMDIHHYSYPPSHHHHPTLSPNSLASFQSLHWLPSHSPVCFLCCYHHHHTSLSPSPLASIPVYWIPSPSHCFPHSITPSFAVFVIQLHTLLTLLSLSRSHFYPSIIGIHTVLRCRNLFHCSPVQFIACPRPSVTPPPLQ